MNNRDNPRMKVKLILKFFTVLCMLFSFACKDELEDCYETVCSGPNNTNCVEVPDPESGCFPRDAGAVIQETS